MTTTKMSGVPDGLPARFDDPDSGFTRLCEFLEIVNRAQQQSIINTEGVKRVLRSWKADVQKLPTAKRRRLLLTVFYSFADERRALWKHIQNVSSDMPIDVPSFEYHALRGYDAELSKGDMTTSVWSRRSRSFLMRSSRSPTCPSGNVPPWQSGPIFGRT